MTKDELVTRLAESSNITKKKADEILSVLAESISEALRKGEKTVPAGNRLLLLCREKGKNRKKPSNRCGDQDTGKESGKIFRINGPGHGAQYRRKGEDRLGDECYQEISAAMGQRLVNENSERPTPP